MRRIRAYLLFTSRGYKLGIFLGLPVAVLAGGLFWRHFDAAPLFGYLMTAGIIFVETMMDQGVFSAIQSKGGYKLDFLKTSPAGREMLFQGLSGDLARRLLTAAVCIGIGRALKVLAVEGGRAGCLGIVLAVYFAEVSGLFISRFTRSVILCLFTAYGGIAVGMLLYALVDNVSLPELWAVDGALALAAAAMSVTVARTGMKRWCQTYSDGQ